MIESKQAKNVEISGVTFKNSPQHHISIHDCANIYVHDLVVDVDMWGQIEWQHLLGGEKREIDLMLGALNLLNLPTLNLPTFPLNTDGFDLAG